MSGKALFTAMKWLLKVRALRPMGNQQGSGVRGSRGEEERTLLGAELYPSVVRQGAGSSALSFHAPSARNNYALSQRSQCL